MTTVTTYDLYIPERRWTPFRAILNCPERLYVAWHRDAEGIHELLDGDGNMHGHPPRDTLWEVRVYERVIHYPDAAAFYERVNKQA